METQKKSIQKGKSKFKIKEPELYDVIMLNDDFTPMDFVVDILTTYFEKTGEEATELMLQIHKGKKAVVATYIYDIALTKSYKVMQVARDKGYPLKVVVDKTKKK